jgi:hypothetical protein
LKKKRQRNIRISFWVTAEFKEQLEAKARESRISISELIRKSSEQIKIIDNKSLVFQVRKAGVNLNQISKRCNETRAVDIATLQQLIIIEKMLRRLL